MPTAALRVLVVDDNRDGADALGLLAEELGHEVHVAYGGVTALDAAQALQPDLMLIDLAMPDMDGCSLVRRIHDLPGLNQTKLVAITGHADQGHKTFALKAGFDAVLFKPVTLAQIKAALASVVPVLAQTISSPRPSEGLAAVELLPKTFSVIDRSAKIGIIKQNTAARYKSKLNLKVKALAA